MAKRKVFVCFDYENDKHYKFLLEAWDANKEFDFSFRDVSSSEINTSNISRVKAGLTDKINQATTTLVIVGKYANSLHLDSDEIGYRNWQCFEIAKSKAAYNRLVAVKIEKSYTSPENLLNSDASWAMSFTQDAIIKALNA